MPAAPPSSWLNRPTEEYEEFRLPAAGLAAARACAEPALETVWSGSQLGRYPAAPLPLTLRNATDGDPHRAHALVAARRESPDSGHGPPPSM
ncbi:hypothetical protein [Streptomyces hyaluromycini]|uniref:hypothetical protein n=1 Tax=Streptomyces hyaluromycini TaxID=1377993 RepID=UPI0011AE19A2|nr:hypothetical protein [Streptomyces hyaluromycini]